MPRKLDKPVFNKRTKKRPTRKVLHRINLLDVLKKEQHTKHEDSKQVFNFQRVKTRRKMAVASQKANRNSKAAAHKRRSRPSGSRQRK